MLWLVKEEASHQIMSCNIHEDKDVNGNPCWQMWITRPNGKNLKVDESDSKKSIEEIKEAIDFAIENNERVLRLTS